MFITVSKTELTKRIKWGTDGQLKANYYIAPVTSLVYQDPEELKTKLTLDQIRMINKCFFDTDNNKIFVVSGYKTYILKKYSVFNGEEKETENEMFINRSILPKLIKDGSIYGRCKGIYTDYSVGSKDDYREKEFSLIKPETFTEDCFKTDSGYFKISTDGNHVFSLYTGHSYAIKFKEA